MGDQSGMGREHRVRTPADYRSGFGISKELKFLAAWRGQP